MQAYVFSEQISDCGNNQAVKGCAGLPRTGQTGINIVILPVQTPPAHIPDYLTAFPDKHT